MGTKPKPLAAMLSTLIVIGSLPGCATIVNGRTQDVALGSNPPAARVTLENIQTTTPGRVTLRRNQDYDLVFTKEGFPDRTAMLKKTGSWWMLANVIFGGVIGLIVDLTSGGGYKLVPESVDMDMATGAVKEVKEKKVVERNVEEKK